MDNQKLLQNIKSIFGERFDNIDKKFDNIDKKFDNIDKKFDNINKKFDNIDKKFDNIDKKFDNINKKFDKLSNSLGFETESRANAFLNKEIECKHKIGENLFDYATGSYKIWDTNKTKREQKTEIDNILVNSTNIGIVETKTLLEPMRIRKFLSKNLKYLLASTSIKKRGKTVTIKDKDHILFFMCQFISKEDEIKEILQKSGKKFYIYQEEPYRKFKMI